MYQEQRKIYTFLCKRDKFIEVLLYSQNSKRIFIKFQSGVV